MTPHEAGQWVAYFRIINGNKEEEKEDNSDKELTAFLRGFKK